MGKIEKIDLMVEGGNAKTDQAMAQRLGPLGVNLQNVIKIINTKTAPFKGIRIPVKIEVDVNTKAIDVKVGSPPTSELIKKEFNMKKGSGTPDKEKIGNAGIEHIIKIAKMKSGGLYVNSLKAAVKTIAGSANSMGLLVEGMISHEFNQQLDAGEYDTVMRAETTEVTLEKERILKEQLASVQEVMRKEAARLKAVSMAAKPEEEKKESEVTTDDTKKPEGIKETTKPDAKKVETKKA